MSLPLAVALRLNARRFPRKPALRFGQWEWGYAELYAKVCRLMNALMAQGLGPRDHVALLPPNHPDTLVAYFALTGIGAIPVPINHQLDDEDLVYIARKADTTAAILLPETADKLGTMRGVTGRLYFLGEPDPGATGVTWLDPLMERAGDEEPSLEHAHQRVLSHTSGTTGRPKCPLRGEWAFEERAIEQGFSSDDYALSAIPLCVGIGLTYTLQSLYLGATVRLMPSFDPAAAMDIIDREAITATTLLPFMLRKMMEAPQFQSFSGRSLKLIQSGAGVVEADIRHAFHAKTGPVLSIYAASTEVGPIANLKGEDVVRYAEGNCVGRPFFGVEVKLLDDDLKEVPVGEVGEICARSHTQYEGYYGDPELTEETRRGDYYTVGDLGRFDADGYLYFVGRKGDVIRIGGTPIFATEIEETLMAHPGVAEAACVGLPEADGEAVLWAAVVPKPGCTEADLQAHCAQRLPVHKRPARFALLDALPRTVTGRVIKNRLKTLLHEQAVS